ncbi:complement factor H-like, partial [Clarias magur]
ETCPTITNLGDVIATGKTEEATSGDVIHFECESPKKLNGPEDIRCQDNGQWSGPIPTCTRVICQPPEIPHGFSDPNKVYKENNILQYRCDPGYTPRYGNSWCTKSGWSIKPECEEMICLLGALAPGIASTNPKGKNIFKVGEVVEITCSNSQWLFERTHESRKIKCQTNGMWEVPPGCEDPICEYPRGERLVYPTEPNHRMLYTSKESIQYRCELGYKGTPANITCTENNWEPKPLCTVVRCPIISNLGDVIATGNTEKATHGDVIHFECDSPKILSGPEDIHCQDNGQWSGPVPKCIGVICQPPEIPHGFSDPNKVYKENNVLQYRCDPGYTPRYGNSWCTKSGWSIKPECEEMICLLGALAPGIASTNPKGKNIFKVGEVVEITCSNSQWLFERMHESRKIKCQTNGKWEVPPRCEEPICEYPRGERLLYPTEPNHRMLYTLKERIQYRCELGYNATAANITCTENNWEPKPLCTGNKCLPPEIPHAFTNPATEYEENNILQYRCEPGYKSKAEYSRCTKYGWSILPECEEITCEYPQGQHLSSPPESNYGKPYKLNEKIQYHCDYGYKGTATSATCTENGWEPKPLCT